MECLGNQVGIAKGQRVLAVHPDSVGCPVGQDQRVCKEIPVLTVYLDRKVLQDLRQELEKKEKRDYRALLDFRGRTVAQACPAIKATWDSSDRKDRVAIAVLTDSMAYLAVMGYLVVQVLMVPSARSETPARREVPVVLETKEIVPLMVRPAFLDSKVRQVLPASRANRAGRRCPRLRCLDRREKRAIREDREMRAPLD